MTELEEKILDVFRADGVKVRVARKALENVLAHINIMAEALVTGHRAE